MISIFQCAELNVSLNERDIVHCSLSVPNPRLIIPTLTLMIPAWLVDGKPVMVISTGPGHMLVGKHAQCGLWSFFWYTFGSQTCHNMNCSRECPSW